MSHRRLILFTRYPLPGRTKTRLIPALGEQGAADLHRAMTEHTVEAVRPLGEEGVRIEVRYEGGNLSSMAGWLGQNLLFLPQGEGDLGGRMDRAFRDSVKEGAGKTVIVGTDCPDLDAQDIREAFQILDSNSVVLGPAADGGYYLIGIQSGAPERLYGALFTTIPWGTSEVFSSTVNALASAGIQAGLLDEKADVDEPEDLVHWERKIRIQETEDRRRKEEQDKAQTRAIIPSTASISVVIPALNEQENIGEVIERLQGSSVEIIVADGGSTDETVAICRRAGAKVIVSKPGRGAQLNRGAAEAGGQILFFLHADAIPPGRFPDLIRAPLARGAVGGAFSFGTDLGGLSMRIVTFGANHRARLLGIVFGDQGIFVRADLFRRIGGFPDLPVMEDREFVRELKRRGRFVILPERVVSSARKWRANGVWRVTFLNQVVMWLYLIGVNADRLGIWYRERLKGN